MAITCNSMIMIIFIIIITISLLTLTISIIIITLIKIIINFFPQLLFLLIILHPLLMPSLSSTILFHNRSHFPVTLFFINKNSPSWCVKLPECSERRSWGARGCWEQCTQPGCSCSCCSRPCGWRQSTAR